MVPTLEAVLLQEYPEDRAVRWARGLLVAASLGLFAIALLALLLGFDDWPRSPQGVVTLFSDTMTLGVALWIAALSAGLGAVFLAVNASRRDAARSASRGAPRGGRIGLGFALFAVMMLTAASLQVKSVQRSSRAEQLEQQIAIARLKADQLDAWVDERFMALHLLASSLAGFSPDRIAAQPDIRSLVELSLVQFLANDPERVAAGIFRADGTSLALAGSLDPTELGRLAEEVRGVADSRVPAVGPIRTRPRTPAGLSLAFLVPLRVAPRFEDRIVVVSVIDPTVSLLRRIGDWPGYGAAGDIELVTRLGNQLVQVVPPLSPAGSLDESIFARTGVSTWDAEDPRGTRSLAASLPVRQLPWIVIARTDRRLAEARTEGQVRSIWAMTLATILFGGLLTLALDALLLITRASARERQDRHRRT